MRPGGSGNLRDWLDRALGGRSGRGAVGPVWYGVRVDGQCFSQYAGDGFRWRGPVEQEALREVALHVLEEGGLLGCLHALGDGG